MSPPLAAYLAILLCQLSAHVLSLPATTLPPLSLTINGNITLSPNATNLNAPPPPGFHIDGTSLFLPHKYRITFENYGPPLSADAAATCLAKAAAQYHLHPEINLMGARLRTYTHGSVMVGIIPQEGLTWGYWGAAIRAVDSMWRSWDVIELEFVIGVETKGVLGRGFLTSVDSER